MEDTKDYRPLISINGNPLPTPSSYSVNIETFVDGQRNADGVMIGEEIRGGILKVDIIWSCLKPEKWSWILSLFTGNRNITGLEENNMQITGSFTNYVTILNPETNRIENLKMYVSDRHSISHVLDENGTPSHWLECTLSLIEV